MGEGAEGGMGEGVSDVAAGGIPTTSGFEAKGFRSSLVAEKKMLGEYDAGG